jgi:hypothetical protein
MGAWWVKLGCFWSDNTEEPFIGSPLLPHTFIFLISSLFVLGSDRSHSLTLHLPPQRTRPRQPRGHSVQNHGLSYPKEACDRRRWCLREDLSPNRVLTGQVPRGAFCHQPTHPPPPPLSRHPRRLASEVCASSVAGW